MHTHLLTDTNSIGLPYTSFCNVTSAYRGELYARLSATEAIDDATLVDLGAPSDLGGRVLEGDPKISARIDYQADGMTAGIFEATTGIVEIHFPFTEHVTIIEGEVTITDESGQRHTIAQVIVISSSKGKW